MMESIQLAQMLADLSDLNAAQETQAANALVNANKTLGPAPPPAESAKQLEQPAGRPGLRNHKRTGSGGSAASTGSSFMSRTASPAKFDKYGRRILTPPNTRTNSAYGSVPGTPRRDPEGDDDVDRANTLMALYDIRAKLKDQDSSRNLSKLREKIAALHAKQTLAEKKDGDAARTRFSFPKSS
ncbi:hypothetical protein C8A05DRAFT_13783 [Staphylotrichum tortipilum]|uniref:Uncharacterized protein n=1 Tax=Staphylotrichum tortipilum TaxID=2831512 RepID=A0AAN6MNS1_9PEZI|nr:hypothetical protein C8A05DRAFT_13783 [Staphylotrichum longicolle]